MTRILERLFVRLTEIYPEFDGLPEDWQDIIGDLSVDEIKRGLSRLDPTKYCPTPGEFRDLCAAHAKDAVKVLQKAPQIPPETPPLSQKPVVGIEGSKTWAHRLKARYEAGEHLSAIQIKYAESALGYRFSTP